MLAHSSFGQVIERGEMNFPRFFPIPRTETDAVHVILRDTAFQPLGRCSHRWLYTKRRQTCTKGGQRMAEPTGKGYQRQTEAKLPSENQREVQNAYNSHDSATVHPIVAYYKSTECREYVNTEAYPDNPVSAAMFYRPRNVKCKVPAKCVGCLCEYCENLQRKIEAINRINKEHSRIHISYRTMCPKSTGWAYDRPEYIARTCDKYGTLT